MITASFGGLLKDFRIRKDLSQRDVAYAMGWSEPSRLSRIEQGKTKKPTRENVHQLFEAMRLSKIERNKLLLAGGYLPTEEEIVKIRHSAHTILTEWKYPVVLLDFSWRIIDINDPANELYQMEKYFGKTIHKQVPNVLETIFHPIFINNILQKMVILEEQQAFLRRVLVHFRYAQQGRSRDQWYITLLNKMMKNVHFKQLWKEAQLESVDEINDFATNYGKKMFPHPSKNQLLCFNFFVVSALEDPRFDVEFHIPSDIETYQYFQKK